MEEILGNHRMKWTKIKKWLYININRKPIEWFPHYCYLGSKITEDYWSELNVISKNAQRKNILEQKPFINHKRYEETWHGEQFLKIYV